MKPADKPLKVAIRNLRHRIEDMRREKLTPEQQELLTQDAYAQYRKEVRESRGESGHMLVETMIGLSMVGAAIHLVFSMYALVQFILK